LESENIVYTLRPDEPVYYINLTNACTNDCSFCVRQGHDTVGTASTLWLEKDPDVPEVMDALIAAHTRLPAREIVFCGFGEPMMKLDVLLEVARRFRALTPTCPIRVNTNGHGNLIAKTDITPRLSGLIDTLSISLNASTPAEYVQVCKPIYGEDAFWGLLDFAQKAQSHVKKVVLSIVSGQTSEEECRKLLESRGLTLRVRTFIE
jgi:TatD family-associated radical SAM protein